MKPVEDIIHLEAVSWDVEHRCCRALDSFFEKFRRKVASERRLDMVEWDCASYSGVMITCPAKYSLKRVVLVVILD